MPPEFTVSGTMVPEQIAFFLLDDGGCYVCGEVRWSVSVHIEHRIVCAWWRNPTMVQV
jgi:hypothetical protein